MIHEKGRKKVVVVDDNPLHIKAFKEVARRVPGVDLLCFSAEQLLDGTVSRADLYLLGMELHGSCSQLLLHCLFEQHTESIVICYMQSMAGSSVSHFKEHRHRLFLLCHDLLDEHLEDVLNRVASEDSLPAVDQLICRALSVEDDAHYVLKKLSMRELEIFCMVGKGCTAQGIAGRLNISKNTVDTHIKGIRRKLGGLDGVDLRMNSIQLSRSSGCEVLSKGSEHICPHINDSIGRCPCCA